MRAVSSLFFLTALFGGINAQEGAVGTFDTFVDENCDFGGEGTTINTSSDTGVISPERQSIKAYIERDCYCKCLELRVMH